jgi:uncharacterized membrane protein YphA (DoxX/SURF4 family)
MLEYTGGNPAAARSPIGSLLKTVAILRIGTGVLLLTRHGAREAVNAYHFFWKEQAWDWVKAFSDAGIPNAVILTPLTALVLLSVGVCWTIGFLTRLFSVLFLPFVITAIVLLQKAGSAYVEAAWLYLFIAVTLLLFGSGAVSVDQLFRLGEGGSHSRR